MVREERGRFDSASSSYMEDQQLLARQLCSDFAFGTRDACNATALQQYCYLRCVHPHSMIPPWPLASMYCP